MTTGEAGDIIAGEPAPARITVNGRAVEVKRHVLTYEDAVRLADRRPEHRPTVTVAYKAPTLLRDLGLAPREYAVVRPGMVINVGLASRA